MDEKFDDILEEELAKYGKMLPKEFVKEFLRAQKPMLPQIFKMLEPQILPIVSTSLTKVFNEGLGVLSLSAVRDSILMWSHYANDHTGFVVGFDSSNQFFDKRRSKKDEFGFLREVQYAAERPEVVLSNTSAIPWFQTKAQEWSYEKEWRIVRVLREASEKKELTPSPVYLFDFPPDAVIEVIVGMRSTMAEQIWALKSRLPKAIFLKASGSVSRYKLDISPLLTSSSAAAGE